jgi:hypothetical protein
MNGRYRGSSINPVMASGSWGCDRERFDRRASSFRDLPIGVVESPNEQSMVLATIIGATRSRLFR